MNALPITGELFATNQVSPETERCYKYQLRNFAQWMRDNCDVEDMEDVTTAEGIHQLISVAHLQDTGRQNWLM